MTDYLKRLLDAEFERQNLEINLIASENFVSEDILKVLGSSLTNKYTEGYPKKRSSGNTGRYYSGTRYYDEIEEYCCQAFQNAFDTSYHANVQPHSGTSANLAAYMAILKPGDKVLSMSLSDGGHLSHGAPASISGKLFDFCHYGLTEKGFIDYGSIEDIVKREKPKLVVAGASAYPREIDFEYFRDICNRYGCLLMVDMAHIAGLVASSYHSSPFLAGADIVTATTHKTLRGPRGGVIFCKPGLAMKIDSAVFPCCQGGPLQNVIAAKAICAEEAMTEEFQYYMYRVVSNCRAMATSLNKLGFDLITGGTDNHLLLIDLSKTHPELTGKQAQDILESNGFLVNKNCVPGEKRSPKEASGIRIGTAAETTRGKNEIFFKNAAVAIDLLLRDYKKE